MILWLIPIVGLVFFVIGLLAEDGFLGFMAGLAMSFITLIALCLGVAIFESTCEPAMYREMTRSYEISAFADNPSYSTVISRSAYVVRIRGESDLDYQFMYKVEGKGYTFDEVDADQSYINLNSDSPRLEVYEYRFVNDFLTWLIGSPVTADKEYIFYLPPGAEIIDSYAIDFE